MRSFGASPNQYQKAMKEFKYKLGEDVYIVSERVLSSPYVDRGNIIKRSFTEDECISIDYLVRTEGGPTVWVPEADVFDVLTRTGDAMSRLIHYQNKKKGQNG